VLYARLICSDGDCDEVFEAWGTLEELEALACDCGCTLEVVSLAETDATDTRPQLEPLR
jgi:hypothetical protein